MPSTRGPPPAECEAPAPEDEAVMPIPEWALEADLELEKSNILLLVSVCRCHLSHAHAAPCWSTVCCTHPAWALCFVPDQGPCCGAPLRLQLSWPAVQQLWAISGLTALPEQPLCRVLLPCS